MFHTGVAGGPRSGPIDDKLGKPLFGDLTGVGVDFFVALGGSSVPQR